MGRGMKSQRLCVDINVFLPLELLEGILHRVTPRFVAQYKCVCKLWCSIIPAATNNKKNIIMEAKEWEIEVAIVAKSSSTACEGNDFSLDFLPCFSRGQSEEQNPDKLTWIAGFSNGILLCSAGKNYQTQYYICSPTDKNKPKQFMALPPTPRTHPRVHVGFVCNYNSATSDHDLLVVRFPAPNCNELRSDYEVETLSLSFHDFDSQPNPRSRWKTTTVTSPKPFLWGVDPNGRCVVHNGWLHWLLSSYRVLVYDPYNSNIRTLIEPPSNKRPCTPMGCLALCQGSLWIAQTYHESRINHQGSWLSLWQLKGGSGTSYYNVDEWYWSLQHRVNLEHNQVSLTRRWDIGERAVLALHPFNPQIVYVKVSLGIIFQCNLETGLSKKVINSRKIKKKLFYRWEGVFTLVSATD